MKENKLSVWKFPYRKTYYLTHPWKWFHDLYWNIRNFWHRGRYGFAYVDVWEFSDWWPKAGAAALRYMAEHGSGYPGCEPWETPKKWYDHLFETAAKLDWCAESNDILYNKLENEYAEEMDKIYYDCATEELGPDGLINTWLEMTPEQKEIRDKYFQREQEILEERNQKRKEIFANIGENLTRYWD